MRNARYFLLLTLALLPFSGIPATNTVTTTADNGAGSLRQVIVGAAAGDTIVFSVSGIITLTNGELLVNKSLTILGPGAAVLSVERSTAAGTPDFRIFNIQSGVVTVSGLTIRNGRAVDGGGIHNEA